ncbi:MAG: hypothetical protein WBV39_10680, partial [Rudaea sp.]
LVCLAIIPRRVVGGEGPDGLAARYIGHQATQFHASMDVMDKQAVTHYVKRRLAFELRCGTSDQHPENYRSRLCVE